MQRSTTSRTTSGQTRFFFRGAPPESRWPGAHSQGATLDELQANLQEVVAMLLEDGEPQLEAEFIGTQTIRVA